MFRTRDEAPTVEAIADGHAGRPEHRGGLSLADDSPGASLDYFCRGLRDEIVHALTSIKALRVLAVRRDERRPHDREEAALVITGGVRSARDQLRVTIHLVDGASGYYLWSESADVDQGDPVSGQEAIARRIAEKLVPEVNRDAVRAPGNNRTISPPAISICRAATISISEPKKACTKRWSFSRRR